MIRRLADILNASDSTRRVVCTRFPEETIEMCTAVTILDAPGDKPIGWSPRRLLQRRGNVVITNRRPPNQARKNCSEPKPCRCLMGSGSAGQTLQIDGESGVSLYPGEDFATKLFSLLEGDGWRTQCRAGSHFFRAEPHRANFAAQMIDVFLISSLRFQFVDNRLLPLAVSGTIGRPGLIVGQMKTGGVEDGEHKTGTRESKSGWPNQERSRGWIE